MAISWQNQLRLTKELFAKFWPVVIFFGYCVGASYEAGYLGALGFGDPYGSSVLLTLPFTWRDFLLSSILGTAATAFIFWTLCTVAIPLLVFSLCFTASFRFSSSHETLKGFLYLIRQKLMCRFRTKTVASLKNKDARKEHGQIHAFACRVLLLLKFMYDICLFPMIVFVSAFLAFLLCAAVSFAFFTENDISVLAKFFYITLLLAMWLLNAGVICLVLAHRFAKGAPTINLDTYKPYFESSLAVKLYLFLAIGFFVIGICLGAQNIGLRIGLEAISKNVAPSVELVVQHGEREPTTVVASHIRTYDNFTVVVQVDELSYLNGESLVKAIRNESIRSQKIIVTPQTVSVVRYRPFCAILRITRDWCYWVERDL